MHYIPSQIFIGLFLLFQSMTSRGLNCPQSFAEQQDRASLCASQNLYHCLYNEYGQVVEICKQPIWVSEGRCPEYNTRALKLNYIACLSDRGQCPPASFLSNELYKYSACIPIQRIIDTTSHPVFSSTHLNITEVRTEETSAITFPVVLSIVLLIILVLVGLAVFICLKRRHGLQKVKQNTDNETVLENLVSPNEELQDNANENDIDRKEEYPAFHILPQSVNILMEKKAVMILGTWGDGKSTLARQIRETMKQYTEFQNIRTILLQSLNKWEFFIPENECCIVQLSNCVKNWYSDKYIPIIKKQMMELTNKRPRCYFIILSRFLEWSRLNLDKEKTFPIIDAPNMIQNKEKKELLLWHETKNKITAGKVDTRLEHLISQDKHTTYFTSMSSAIGFLGIVNLICRNKRLQLKIDLVLKDPIQALEDDLEYLRKSGDKDDFCYFIVLVYAMLNGGMFNINVIDLELLHKIQGVYCSDDGPFNILPDRLRFEYLSTDSGYNGNYYMEHTIISRVLFRVVARHNLDLLIDECDAELLLDCIEIYGYKRVPGECLRKLAERFKHLESEKQRSDIKYHTFISKRNFRKLFEYAK